MKEDKHEERLTNVEVCNLKPLLLRQLQHHLDVVCVESAQRVPPQQRHLLPGGVPQVLDQDAGLGSLKITVSTETSAVSCCSHVTNMEEYLPYPCDFGAARQTLKPGNHFLCSRLFGRLF